MLFLKIYWKFHVGHTVVPVYTPNCHWAVAPGGAERWSPITPEVSELWFPQNRLEINSTLRVPVIYYYLIPSVKTNAFTWELFHRLSQEGMTGFVNATFTICVSVLLSLCWAVSHTFYCQLWGFTIGIFLKSTVLFQHDSPSASKGHNKE